MAQERNERGQSMTNQTKVQNHILLEHLKYFFCPGHELLVLNNLSTKGHFHSKM